MGYGATFGKSRQQVGAWYFQEKFDELREAATPSLLTRLKRAGGEIKDEYVASEKKKVIGTIGKGVGIGALVFLGLMILKKR